jgi:hypothetical protein
MLVTSFFSGFRDLLLTPSKAFLRSPTDPSVVGIGVAKGTLSLVSHSTSGFFGFLSRVSASAGQVVATLSLDPDFSAWHRTKVVTEAMNLNRQWKRRGMQSVRAMIERPVGDLAAGVAGGVFGIVISPIKGYRRAGSSGLVKGLAVGFVGVFARPTVGVLDAFTHFTASIHDIAKSVNVLDRRLQPASRIRLPYTFGFMNVLMPYNDSRARADYLLRFYPMEKSLKKSLAIPETIVHVEVLPNNAISTFAIATTARVVLIRLKKELSGDLTHSLCWELSFTKETETSSRVSEHGHSGVALTVTLVKPAESITEAVETPTSLGTADKFRSPAFPKNLIRSQRNLDASSVRPVVDTSKDYDHQIGPGVQGEPLEWFTVLAEYQYRRQLEQLHNAICCIVGDFSAILRDPSLPPHGSSGGTEGYTSFGIYHFAPRSDRTASSTGAEPGFASLLEMLPWASERQFREVSMKSPDSRNIDLKTAPKGRGSSEYLDSSKEEGGPEWLVAARDKALQMSKTDVEEITELDVGTLLNADPASRLVSWGQRATLLSPFGNGGMETIPNSPQCNDEQLQIENVAGRSIPSPQLSESTLQSFRTARCSMSAMGDLRSHSSVYGSLSKHRISEDEGLNALQSQGDSLRKTSSRNTDPLSPLEASGVSSSVSVGLMETLLLDGPKNEIFSLTSQSQSAHSSVSHEGRANVEQTVVVSDHLKPMETLLEDVPSSMHPCDPSRGSLPYATAEDKYHPPLATTAYSEGNHPTVVTGEPNTNSEGINPSVDDSGRSSIDRLSRMEALMERLLIFSSEQALLREQQARATPAQGAGNETALLRQEVEELRRELQLRTAMEPNASEMR